MLCPSSPCMEVAPSLVTMLPGEEANTVDDDGRGEAKSDAGMTVSSRKRIYPTKLFKIKIGTSPVPLLAVLTMFFSLVRKQVFPHFSFSVVALSSFYSFRPFLFLSFGRTSQGRAGTSC